jgi:hypothetical protein
MKILKYTYDFAFGRARHNLWRRIGDCITIAGFEKKYIVCFFLQFLSLQAEQFIYPVADFDEGKQLILLHQKSLQDIELWITDTTSGLTIKGLSSFLTPVNVRMMPSGKGFSFIDQGYIKIKEFAKRSAQTLPIYESIGLFSNMHWIDDDNFYFVALQGDFFQVFTSDVQANIHQITNEHADALYPQKIDETLFYVRKTVEKNIEIVTKSWNNRQEDPKILISLQKKQICFLRMINATEGFYLQIPPKKNLQIDSCYEFDYQYLQKIDGQWISTKICTLQIPAKYITGKDRLYESIEPFLPQYHASHIYFTSWNADTKNFELLKYSLQHNSLQNISTAQSDNSQQLFSSYVCDHQIYCGLIIPEQKSLQFLEHSDMIIDLPKFQIE